MLLEQTFKQLTDLKMHVFATALSEQLSSKEHNELSFEDRLGLLVDREWSERQSRKLTRRLQQAKLREQACVEDLDYRNREGLNRSLVVRLSTCHWVKKGQNILVTGPTGVGKTYVACALAQKACREGHSSIYRRLPRLLQELTIARLDGSLSRLLGRLSRIHVLLLDDLCLAPMTDTERRDLLEVLEDRHGLRSTIVTSQYKSEQWHERLGDPTIADAILDRLVHNAHRIELSGPSLRKLYSTMSDNDEETT